MNDFIKGVLFVVVLCSVVGVFMVSPTVLTGIGAISILVIVELSIYWLILIAIYSWKDRAPAAQPTEGTWVLWILGTVALGLGTYMMVTNTNPHNRDDAIWFGIATVTCAVCAVRSILKERQQKKP